MAAKYSACEILALAVCLYRVCRLGDITTVIAQTGDKALATEAPREHGSTSFFVILSRQDFILSGQILFCPDKIKFVWTNFILSRQNNICPDKIKNCPDKTLLSCLDKISSCLGKFVSCTRQDKMYPDKFYFVQKR